MAWLYQPPNFKKTGLAEILQTDFKVDRVFYTVIPKHMGSQREGVPNSFCWP